MSGFEPLFMAEAFAPVAAESLAATIGTEIGTAALFGEVAGTGMMMGLPTLGAAVTPTVMNGLAALPQAAGLAGSLTPAVAPALTGLASGQVPALLNQSLQGVLSAPEIAQMTKGATDIVANAQNLGQVAQASAPTITDAGMQNVYNAYRQAAPVAPELVAQAPIDPSATLPAGTPFTQPGLPGAMTGTPTPLPSQFTKPPGLLDQALDYIKDNKMQSLSMGMNAMNLLGKGKGGGSGKDEDEKYDGPLSKFKFDPSRYVPGTVTPPTPYTPVYKNYRMAGGGLADLGGYSDGGRMLKGPGDGMSDNIPATIAGKQPARLANEEFVVPADVVSHLGNGSSEAGAKQLYKMMDRVRQARTGKKAQGKQINAAKMMPA